MIVELTSHFVKKKSGKNVKQPRRWRDCGGKREFPWDRGWNVTIPKGSTP